MIKVLMHSLCLAPMERNLFFAAIVITAAPEIPIFLLLIGWSREQLAVGNWQLAVDSRNSSGQELKVDSFLKLSTFYFVASLFLVNQSFGTIFSFIMQN